ncbi:MAG: hypothetical protein AVDCRST_MAG38-2258 [uncultured Solirubrobacteraceae bacterium]|uniref:Lipoprotein n=1 Tax=uncultured Solirubrobacteraceae bacterium TaxID=1162706 RepID=A0A6J4S4P1_9ACTN|nr:MAG: hypothetical protein AVDCRST_MAG38-2258 [uncultured Solirubrobacteraceae bacterium]
MLARLLLICCLALASVGLAACGGQSEDVDTLLEETFTGDKQVDSGRLSLKARIDARGSERLEGPVALEVRGPFQKGDEGDDVPEFDLDASLSGSGLTFRAGASAVGDRGYVLFQDEDYVLSPELFAQFKAGFRDARADQEGGKADAADLATLGIDPRQWLRNARNAGEAKVGDEDTIRITGDVDVPKLLDDVTRARESGGDPAAGRTLSEEQRTRIEQAVKAMRVEIFTGAEDRTLRRLVLDADVVAPEGEEGFDSADVRLDYSITELNEDQEISAPRAPKPFDDLARQLRGLDLGGAAAGSGAAAPADRRRLRRYTRCVERAGRDEAAVRECAERL